MASVVLVEDRKLAPISEFIADLCEVSDIDRRKISIRSSRDGDKLGRSHITVLNGGQPNLNLAKALDSVIAGGVIIMNSDERNFSGLRLSKPVRLITYGYNPKSTVTASSIIVHDNISIQYCIQRQFSTLAGTVLEPQEFLIRTNHAELAAEDILAATSVALLCGAKADKISSVN